MPTTRRAAPVLAAILLAAGSPHLASAQIVKIGVSGPLSGPNAFAGKDDENGVLLAVEELNARKMTIGGHVLRFELQSEDDQGDPKAGVAVAQKFADGGVHFVVGPYNSGVALPAARVYTDAGIHSVPAIIINDQHLISGGQPAEVFERALRQIAGAQPSTVVSA